MKKKVDKASAGSGVSRGVKVRVIQLGGGRGQAPSENKTETKQESRNEAGIRRTRKLIF